MSGTFIVALDQGTSGCRAVAVDPLGHVCAWQEKAHSPRRLQAGISEYTAEELWKTQVEVLQALLDKVGPQQVVALSVCSQRSTIVLWDQTTGKSVAPVLTWEDGRSQQQADQAPLSQADIHMQTGLFKTPYFSAPKIAWCLAHSPQAKQAAEKGTLRAAPVASYFIWKLTQGNTFATDPTLAQRTLLWDIHTENWSEALCGAFGVSLSWLPGILPTVSDYGTFTYKGVNIPIKVCVADQQAALVYHRLQKGQTLVNYGTGAFVLHHTGESPVILPGMLSSVAASPAHNEPLFLLEGPVFAAGSVLQWLQAQGVLATGVDVNEICRTAKNPVKFLPAFGGLGAPYWNYQISPIIEGLSPRTRSADFVAGALQGVAHLVADIIAYMAQKGYPAGKIQVSGGLAGIAYLVQAQADLLQLPLEVCLQTQSTVLGAALLAAQRMGWKADSWNFDRNLVPPVLSAQEAQQRRDAWQQLLAQACTR